MTELPADGIALVMRPGVRELEVRRRLVTPPRAGNALVRVDAVGVCGSDIFLQEGGFGDKLPVVPGHEAAGVVVAVGDEADATWVGRQVALYYIDAPASRWSAGDRENLGPDVTRMGVDVDGAFADFVERPVSTLVAVEPPLDPAVVAVATDALATPYHALTRIARVSDGETLAVIGLGGIGSNAVQIGRHLGARVIAIGRGEAKMAQARELGAAEVIASSAGADAIRDLAGGQIDVVLQCVGENTDMDRLAIDIAGYAARVVFVGVSLSAFPISATELIWRELSLHGSRGFTRADIADVIGLVRSGALTTDHLTRNRRPLIEADAALADLRDGRVLRTVLIPDREDPDHAVAQ